MEFIGGRELAAHFEDNDIFDLPQAVRIMGELLDALGYAATRTGAASCTATSSPPT